MANERRLAADFLLGCATAAHQVEGGTVNDWSRWVAEDPSRVADRSDATRACDHLNLYRSDFELLGSMHHNAHRLSLEWSRIEPAPGDFRIEALLHYRDVLTACRAAGMEPVVTLHHFTLPTWFADEGGAASRDAAWRFARFAAVCAGALGDLVTYWVTINEPAVMAVMGYLYGVWPPGITDIRQCIAALRGLLLMHAAAARAVHDVAARAGRLALVSIAHAERPQRPLKRYSLDPAVAALPDWLFNRWFLTSCMRGRSLPPIGRGERVPRLRGSLDYLGVNYYCEDRVAFDVTRPLLARQLADPGLPLSAFGWTIDPPAMTRALVNLWRTLHLPILITENGVADRHDELRPQFLVEHLNAVLDAADRGVDVIGYLHWTAWDNFEWAEGYTKEFGLIAVDRETMRRTPKLSASVFAEIARTRALPAAPWAAP